MKGIILRLAACAGILLAMSACQKSWNCVCTKGAPLHKLEDDTKPEAITVCSNYQASIQVAYPNSTCSIESL